MVETTSPPSRFVALDQFRGYTVFGMLVVNFVGSFSAIRDAFPLLCHHHTYCSYADTIMPQFLFAVGFAYRLTFLRRLASHGQASALSHAVRRNLALLFVAFLVYNAGSRWESWNDANQLQTVIIRWAKHDLMQTLGHIAVTSLWVLLVIGRGPKVRLGFAILSGLLHFVLSYAFYYRWTNTAPNGVDGGPLGFLTWSLPLLCGAWAYDVWCLHGVSSRAIARLTITGVGIMIFAYGLSCFHLAPSDLDQHQYAISFAWIDPPLVHVSGKPPTNDLFSMSQRSGSFTYPLFGAGLSLVGFAFCLILCEWRGWQLGIFRTLGTNALAAYILHEIVSNAIRPFVPKDSPLGYIAVALLVYVGVCWGTMRALEKQKLFLKL
ncbi:MAG: hypothetical protein ACRC8S_00495 [Fimbriiglobus sp.]